MITTFGYRHGSPPARTTHVFDVRSLTHNERSEEFLRTLNGINEWIRTHPGQDCAIGCEEGHHRSVRIADRIGDTKPIGIYHRDKMKPRAGRIVGE